MLTRFVPLLLLFSVIAAAWHIRLWEHPAHGGLVFIRLHEIPPGPVPPKSLDRNQIGPGIVLNGDGTVKEIPVVMVQGPDLMALHRWAEKTGGLAGKRQALLLNGSDAVLPRPAPVNERIFFFVFGIDHVMGNGIDAPVVLSCVVSDELD